ncbi:Vesicle transport through interaction with t-SNAREs -like protein 1A [Collichthys lucidus]|uniref:Vesicle transport through interaction with t-SNAREs-like protein 1A n=1 Tax=Collichthys lucidus TaxID=240159 RepID=A0A4U5VR33_COLLU|nr:Vesicle transport through interaction with t-SNAREs -like protein 1A [Collichthys lucidus]
MSSDFEAYEQDFGTLTAEVTNKIGRIPKLSGEEKTQLVLNVDKQLEEVRELLEQMDLEVREIPIQSRAMYNSRLKSYKQEIEKLEKDFKRSRIAYSDEVRNELLGDDASSSENQRAHLLDNTEKLERSSRRLEAGYQIAVETGTYSVLDWVREKSKGGASQGVREREVYRRQIGRRFSLALLPKKIRASLWLQDASRGRACKINSIGLREKRGGSGVSASSNMIPVAEQGVLGQQKKIDK